MLTCANILMVASLLRAASFFSLAYCANSGFKQLIDIFGRMVLSFFCLRCSSFIATLEFESVHRLSSAKNLNAHEKCTSFVLLFDTFFIVMLWIFFYFRQTKAESHFSKGIFNWKWYTTVVVRISRQTHLHSSNRWKTQENKKEIKITIEKRKINFSGRFRGVSEMETSNMKTKQWSKNQKYEITTHEKKTWKNRLNTRMDWNKKNI